MLDEKSQRIQELSSNMSTAVLDVLKTHSTNNAYHDLVALAACYFRFKKQTVDAIQDRMTENGVNLDARANIDDVLVALENDIEVELDNLKQNLVLPLIDVPDDEFGAN